MNSLVGTTQVLCKQFGRYIGWPSIAQAPNGDLLVVFSGDRDGHVSNDGKVQMVRTCDGGRSWGPATTVFDTEIDDRDSGVLCTAQGTILVSWFTGPYGGPWQGHWAIRSTDNGLGWEDPVPTHVTAPHGPIQLSDGRLLFIGQRPHCSHGEPGDWNGSPSESPYTVSIAESRDEGRSWQVLSDFSVPAAAQMLSYDEPHMAELTNGQLVAMFRDCNGEHYLHQARSSDGGRTWSVPWRTPMRGLPPHLLHLGEDVLLVTYAKRWEPYGVYACLSRDGGATWDCDREFRLSAAPNRDLGYPASVQLGDGSIWTVYYQAEKADEKTCLMGTHWRL